MKKQRITIDIVFLLILLTLFIVCSLTILLSGSHIYQETSNHNDQLYQSRIVLNYISEKIHQSHQANAIEVIHQDQMDVLVCHQDGYTTYIYEDNQQLKEATLDNQQAFDPNYGTVLLDIHDLQISIDNQMVVIVFIDQFDQRYELFMHTI